MSENRIRISERVYLNAHSNELIFLTKSGENRVRIEHGVAQLLQTLSQAAGAVVTKQQLLRSVYGTQEGQEEKALTKHILKLRKIFRKYGWKHAIETIPQKGYRLNTLSCKFRRPFPTRKVTIIAAVILVFILLRIAFPEISQTLQERITHK